MRNSSLVEQLKHGVVLPLGARRLPAVGVGVVQARSEAQDSQLGVGGGVDAPAVGVDRHPPGAVPVADPAGQQSTLCRRPWATTMNAETRTLLKVRLEDAVAAEEIFATLMGENVEQRRKFIEENALDVVNLDI